MILRSWHGTVPISSGDDFERYFNEEVLTELRNLQGNLGAFFRRVSFDAYDHFFLLTYWDGWDSIRAFAGNVPGIAVSYPEDRRFGLIADPIVLHQPCSGIRPWYGDDCALADIR